MSLINKVLQDLDKHQGGAPLPGDLPSGVRVVSPKKKRRQPNHRALWSVLLLAFLGGGGFAFWQYYWLPFHEEEAMRTAARQVAPAMPVLPAKVAAPVIKPTEPSAEPVEAERAETPVRVARVPRSHVSRRAERTAHGVVEVTTDPERRADHMTHNAYALLQQGRVAEARDLLSEALRLRPEHIPARQILVAILVDGRHLAQAEQVLEEGLALAPEQTAFAMNLARLQVERGALSSAVETLRRGLPGASGNAEYRAFLATLLQRQLKHQEAIEQYQAALRLAPASMSLGPWLVGLAISMQAEDRLNEAREAYSLARASGGLDPDTMTFVDHRLRLVDRRLKKATP